MKLSILNFISSTILVFNLWLLHSPILGIIFGLIFVVSASFVLGNQFFKSSSPCEKTLFGFLTFLIFLILPLTLTYYLYQINNIVITIWFILFFLFIMSSRSRSCGREFASSVTKNPIKLKPTKILSILIYFLLLISCYLTLKSGATLESVRTPWAFVSKWFFVIYFLATFILIFLIKSLKTIPALLLTSLHLFFSFSVVNIIFPLGFGYDPFIHQATEKYLLEHGFITPKPFYYIGQYVLVVFFSKILSLSHVLVDRHLVPVLAATLLPTTLYWTFLKINFKKHIARITPLIFLIIPFTILTFTTPQNLADFFVIILAFLGLSYLNCQNPSLYLLSFFALALLLIHPIAGLAALIFITILWLAKLKIKAHFRYPLYFLLSFSSFFAFIFLSTISRFKINLVNNFNLINFFQNAFRFFPDLYLNTNFIHLITTIAYFIWQPLIIFFIILIFTIFIFFKKKLPISSYLLIITFLILFLNSLIVFSFINFDFLIDYERGDFSWRLFNLAIWFLVPLGLISLARFIFQMKKKYFQILIFILIAACLSASLYFSYPRHDRYFTYRGFNTSIHDFNAVKYLDEITPEPYVVLANQQVGAAALTTFGFRYFDNQYFFYSIPTGGPVYQAFWNMVYVAPNYEHAQLAFNLTGANIVYFYLPDFWFNLDKLKSQLEAEANEILQLESGKIWVFKFIKK